MNKIPEKVWLVIAAIFAVGLTILTLSDIALHPGHVITQLGADGGKNNFTYLYHSLYGKGVWFEGMNYPYGEHIVYTDGQPILSVLLSYFRGSVSLSFALWVLYGLISASYVIAMVFTYKTLRHFGVIPIIAILFAGLIIICSPQVFRLSGHYALCYTCVIPMLFYWTAKYHSTHRLKYPAYLFLLGCITVLLHPYFAAVALVWVGSYSAGCLIFDKRKLLAGLRHVAPLLAGVVAVFLLFGLFMKLTDPVKDRPATPYGMLVNCAHANDVLTSAYSPYWDYLSKRQAYTQISGGGEGYAYVGIVVIAVVLISLVMGVVNTLRKKKERNIVSASAFQPVWLFTAFAALLFSMGIPFIWHLEWLLEYFSVLKQFRTLGRFSWLFYYVLTVYGVIIIYNWYSRLIAAGKKAIAYFVLISTLCIWGGEARPYILFSREKAKDGLELYDSYVSAHQQSWNQFLEEHGHSGKDFQAILALSFYEIGSEKLWLENNYTPFAVALSSQAGIQLHLPVVDAMMSRTSWSQALAQVKIAGGPYTDKPMLGDLKTDKPFLLLKVDSDEQGPDQEYLLEAADSIGHYSRCAVYACYPSRIKANDRKHIDSINAILPYVKTGDTCISSSGICFVEHFNKLKADSALFDAGAMSYAAGLFTTLATIAVNPVVDSEVYELSCWALVPPDDFKSPYLNVLLTDSAGNNVASLDGLAKKSTDNYGLWLRMNIVFKMPVHCRSLQCRLGNDPEHSYKIADELMLRPLKATIISKDGAGNIMVNNHRFKH